MGFLNLLGLSKPKDIEATRVTIGIKAATEIECILQAIGPYSVRSILKAIDEGKIEGKFYGDDPEDIEDLKQTGEEFVGCLLGWAGFLENLNHQTIRARAFKVPLALDFYRINISAAAEDFISFIHEGDLPSTNPHLAILRQIVVDELNRKKLLSDKIFIEIPAPVKLVETPELVTV